MEKRRHYTKYCYNPFKRDNHSSVQKSLRQVAGWMASDHNIPVKAKVCCTCRHELQKLRKTEHQDEGMEFDPSVPSSSDTHDVSFLSQLESDPSFSSESIALDALDGSLLEISESPLKRKKLSVRKYAKEKIRKINQALKLKIFRNAVSSDSSEAESEDHALLSHIVNVFKTLDSREKKLMLLTLLPRSWSRRKTMTEFEVSSYIVDQARQLLNQKGPLSSTSQKPGRSLSAETTTSVKQFYESDEISRAMPGKKDCIAARDETGAKVWLPKRLLLANLKELYVLFKDNNPQSKIGFSKFAELRPKNCILAGPKGTHAVCVCQIHQNVKLMIENAHIPALTNGKIKDIKDCLDLLVCDTLSENCIFGQCSDCPGPQAIQSILDEAFDADVTEDISYRQWVSVDRCNLEMFTKSVNDFIDIFCVKLVELRSHHFIAKKQNLFLKEKKENLHDNEIIVHGDFAENYSFVLQDEAQSYHWTSSYATVHPFVIYYKKNGELEHLNYVVISDCLEHNTIAVYVFQKKLMRFLRRELGNDFVKIYYFSDGSSAQYKNRNNFINLTYYKNDFDAVAEWHFFATAHGKGPCDGLGGSVKRLATKASLQRPYDNQIQTPFQLFEWARENIKKIHFEFTTKEDYLETEGFLTERLEKALTIAGTRKFHAYLPSDKKGKISVKSFSFSQTVLEKTVERVSEFSPSIAEISGYVIVAYEKEWWLGYALEKNEEENSVEISFLHPSGPSPSYKFPQQMDRVWCDVSEVLCTVNPTTTTGRVYILTKEDKSKAIAAFEMFTEGN